MHLDILHTFHILAVSCASISCHSSVVVCKVTSNNSLELCFFMLSTPQRCQNTHPVGWNDNKPNASLGPPCPEHLTRHLAKTASTSNRNNHCADIALTNLCRHALTWHGFHISQIFDWPSTSHICMMAIMLYALWKTIGVKMISSLFVVLNYSFVVIYGHFHISLFTIVTVSCFFVKL